MIHLLMQAKKGALQNETSSDAVDDPGFSSVTETMITKAPIPKRG